MKHRSPTLTFDFDDLQPLLTAMRTYSDAHRGWINVNPEVADENLPPAPSPIAALFRSNAPDVALATWTPPDGRQPDTPQIVGLAHRLGNKVVPLLEDFGLEAPSGWRRVQDSPRRGLVVAIPADEDHALVLRWLMKLCVAATRVESTGRWHATLNEGRRSN